VPAGAVDGVAGAVSRLPGEAVLSGTRRMVATASPLLAADCGRPPRRAGGGGHAVVGAAPEAVPQRCTRATGAAGRRSSRP